jgi:hypothetical protein
LFNGVPPRSPEAFFGQRAGERFGVETLENRMAPESTKIPAQGQIVRVRERLYLVEESLGRVPPDDSSLVRLSCVDDDNQGQPLEVLWEHEMSPEILTGEAWEAIGKGGFDDSILFAAQSAIFCTGRNFT